MGVTITKKLTLKSIPKDIKKGFSRGLKAEIADDIVSEILSGRSPVAGHKFKPYKSVKYKGRLSPVDMLRSGKMLESIKVVQNKIGQVLISFRSVIATYHQKGAGSLPIRKLLPSGKEKFNPKLMKKITKILSKAVKKATAKQK